MGNRAERRRRRKRGWPDLTPEEQQRRDELARHAPVDTPEELLDTMASLQAWGLIDVAAGPDGVNIQLNFDPADVQ